jgi:hypothetical protein
MINRVVVAGLVVALAGCDHGTTSATPEGTTDSAVRSVQGLPSDAVLVGLAIQPDNEFYVLDQRSGLYRVDEQSSSLVFNTSGLSGVELTDVVALDSTRFALTAENDGFSFDTQTQELTSYFCYLPSTPPEPTEPDPGQPSGGGSSGPTLPVSISQRMQAEGIAVKQRTESVAFNNRTGQLFAQPQTMRLDDGSVVGSELFVFDRGGGEPIQVLPLEQGFVAGGMVTIPEDRLVLGAGSTIFEATPGGLSFAIREVGAGVVITGMARAPDGAIWVLDGAAKRLLRLDAAL